MSHKFHLDFKKSWISRIGPKLVSDALDSNRQKSNASAVQRKCYEFEFLNWDERCPEKVQVAPIQLKKDEWLFGPATKLSTRSIVYPCSRRKCALPCPCLICHKRHPNCRGENGCNCEECKLYDVDHNNYHGSLHIGCKSCDRLVDAVGVFKFSSIDKNIKPINKGIFRFEIIQPSFELPPASDPRRPLKEFVKRFLVREKWCEKLQNYREGVKDNGMWCYVCSTLFFYEDMLRKHLSIHDAGRIFNHNFGNEDEKAGSKPDLKCYQCSTIFNTKPELIRHIESVHYKEYVDCTDCDETFSRKDSFEAHKKLQHSKSSNLVKTWKCLKCGEIFTMKKNLKRHEREVCPATPDEKVYVLGCDFCEATFIRRSDLKRHTLNRSAKFSCNLCENMFCSNKLFLAHKEKVHGGVSHVGEPMKGKVTIDIGHEVKLFCCDLCGKSFGKEKTLFVHRSTHTDEKGFECCDCGTKFSVSSNLRRHKKEAVFSDGSPKNCCSLCEQVFCTGKLLSSHIISMHKKFTCPVCDQSFTKKHNLERHVFNRKAVTCLKCDKVFCNQKSYDEHINLLHVE